MKKLFYVLILFLFSLSYAAAMEIRTSIQLGSGIVEVSDGKDIYGGVLGLKAEGFDRDSVFAFIMQSTLTTLADNHASGGFFRIGGYLKLLGTYEEKSLSLGYGLFGAGYDYKHKLYYYSNGTAYVPSTSDFGELSGVGQFFEIRGNWEKTLSFSAFWIPKGLAAGTQEVHYLGDFWMYLANQIGETNVGVDTRFWGYGFVARYRRYTDRKKKCFTEFNVFYTFFKWGGGETTMPAFSSLFAPSYYTIKVNPVEVRNYGVSVNFGIYFN